MGSRIEVTTLPGMIDNLRMMLEGLGPEWRKNEDYLR